MTNGVDVSANLVEAVHLIRKARQTNTSLSEMLNQDDIFDGSIDQVTKDFVSIFYRGDKLDKARSSQKVAEALKINKKNVFQQLNDGYFLDVTIVIGKDYYKLKPLK